MCKRIFFAAVLFFLILFSIAAGASDVSPETDTTTQSTDELYSSFGADEAQQQMPDAAKQYIDDKKDISEQINYKTILNFLSNGTYDIIKGAIVDFGKIMAVVVLFMALSAFAEQGLKSYSKTAFHFAAMLCLALVVYDCSRGAINEAANAIDELSVYMKALLPVFAGTMAGSGAVTSAAVLPGIMLTALEILSQVNVGFFLPVLQIYFAVCLAGAASNKVALAGLGSFLKSTVIYCLTGITTIFVSVLGIQRVVAAASDTVAAKAVKFTMGSVIPVVGGIVKDAFDTVAGSIGMIKSVTGAVGIAAIFFTLAPIVIRIVLYTLMFKAATALASLSGNSKISGFLGSISELWNCIFAVTVFEGTILIIGIAAMISVGGVAA